MLETELFPTPLGLATTMFSPYLKDLGYSSKGAKSVLEPSAGNGALADALKAALGGYRKVNISCIEVQQELRFILQEKGYKVVGSDFLEYREPCKYDLILMNPPFSEGVKHVLHAWENFLEGDGNLCALVNWETISNPCTRERQLLSQIISEFGTVSNIGKAFANAERKTNVEVALIRLKKPASKNVYEFDSNSFQKDSIDPEDFFANPLAHPDVIRDMVSRYDACLRTLQERYKKQQELDFYLQGIEQPFYGFIDRGEELTLNPKGEFNDQVAELKARFWNTVFKQSKLAETATSRFSNQFNTFALSQSNLAFTEENIKELFLLFFVNRQQIIQDSIEEVFDKCTKYHDKNVVHIEGWKSNSSWKINKKIILPFGIEYCEYLGFRMLYGKTRDFYNDLDQVLCYLTGKKIKDPDFVSIESAMGNLRKNSDPELISTFFKIRVHKKGTVHLNFLDMDVLAAFNRAAAIHKKWIGTNDNSKGNPWEVKTPKNSSESRLALV